MLGGEPGAEALMAKYGVDFVVIGRSERRDFGANESYFEQRHELILDRADNKVFSIRRESGSNHL
jgi:uncharacterized membrane protein